MTIYNYLADTVVVIHAAYIGFVIFGLLAILVGVLFRWKWVQNVWFRGIHFLAILTVVAQALLGVICPLTTLEKHWRAKGGGEVYSGHFVGHWAHELIFFEAPPWVFTVCYCLIGMVVLVTIIAFPPRRPGRSVQANQGPSEASRGKSGG
ncbi:MAG: DUF2784 domain-containing protein [Planctomycetota bacterium]